MRHEDPALAVRSVIAVPLSFRDRFFGVLAVANPADDRRFTEVEFSLLQSLAEQAALALHNAEFLNLQIEKSQLDLDLSIASGIQQMLLPRQAVAFPGLDLDARYMPAQKVGGDLYDIIPLPDGRPGNRGRGRLRQGHPGLPADGDRPHHPAPDRPALRVAGPGA